MNVYDWNFAKFLVDRSGNVVGRFAPAEKPHTLESAIEALLDYRKASKGEAYERT